MDSTERFSSRVADYVRYRPGYPAAVFDLLEQLCGLGQGTPVCDLGSGTGISCKLLLERGARVYAVEPNPDTRAAAESELSTYLNFISVAAAAESTTLAPQSIQLAFAAQSFHRKDPPRASAHPHAGRLAHPLLKRTPQRVAPHACPSLETSCRTSRTVSEILDVRDVR